MKRALSLLAVTTLGGAASADTTPVRVVTVAPRTLASGAPACGNVMLKYRAEDPVCPTVRSLRAVGRKLAAELKKLDPTRASLTLAPPGRPGL